jgi:hypothetical protein
MEAQEQLASRRGLLFLSLRCLREGYRLSSSNSNSRRLCGERNEMRTGYRSSDLEDSSSVLSTQTTLILKFVCFLAICLCCTYSLICHAPPVSCQAPAGRLRPCDTIERTQGAEAETQRLARTDVERLAEKRSQVSCCSSICFIDYWLWGLSQRRNNRQKLRRVCVHL